MLVLNVWIITKKSWIHKLVSDMFSCEFLKIPVYILLEKNKASKELSSSDLLDNNLTNVLLKNYIHEKWSSSVTYLHVLLLTIVYKNYNT